MFLVCIILRRHSRAKVQAHLRLLEYEQKFERNLHLLIVIIFLIALTMIQFESLLPERFDRWLTIPQALDSLTGHNQSMLDALHESGRRYRQAILVSASLTTLSL